MAGASTNPLKSDPQLKQLLVKLETVAPGKFQRWKASFLARLETFLDAEGISTANAASNDFSSKMKLFVKDLTKIEGFVDRGEMSTDKFTVKAKLSLQNFAKVLTEVIDALEELIPPTVSSEKKRGYTKFHMGASLVKDGFTEFPRLTVSSDILEQLRTNTLVDVADRQILDEMGRFVVKFKKFCDVMADLGLYEVMLKCHEFADATPDPEPEPAEEESEPEPVEEEPEPPEIKMDLIFVDVKTGGLGRLPSRSCIDEGLLNVESADSAANDGGLQFKEAAKDGDARRKLIRLLVESPKLNFGFGNADSKYDSQDVKLAQAQQIQDMWGVSLKKTRNKKGEEFIFVERETCAIGELSRKLCLQHKVVNERENDEGILRLTEEATDWEEKSQIIEEVRLALNLVLVQQ